MAGIAESILSEVHNQRRFKHEWMRMRRNIAIAGLADSVKQNRCPHCNEGIYKRALEYPNKTVLHCLSCGWFTILEGVFDEATALGDAYHPGSTGVIKGTPVVTIDAHGHIKKIEGI